MLMPDQTWTPFIAVAALFISIFNICWNLGKEWWERARLDVNVVWEWSSGPNYEEGLLCIRMTNRGGRNIYIDEIFITESEHMGRVGKLLRRLVRQLRRAVRRPPDPHDYEVDIFYPLGRPVDPLIEPKTSRDHFARVTDDEGAEEPEFTRDWRKMHIIVRSQTGKEWLSASPNEKPGWFVVTEFKPLPPGVALPPPAITSHR
jgi:hypothetical protein